MLFVFRLVRVPAAHLTACDARMNPGQLLYVGPTDTGINESNVAVKSHS